MSRPEHEAMKKLSESVIHIEKSRGSRVLVLSGKITEVTYRKVFDAVKLPVENLDLLIDSPGGYPGDAYKIARFLQRKSRFFSVLVPRYAKSAATLISLGAQKIVMAEGAELGPLDIQMPDPRNSDETISALEGFKGLEAVSAFCHQFLDQSVILVIQRAAARKPKDAVEMATAFAAPVLKPLFEQVDPRELGRLKRALEVAQDYGKRLLVTAGHTPEDSAKIIRKLVHNYPEHAFVIDCDEAQSLGLQAVRCEVELGDAMCAIVDNLPTKDFVGYLTLPTEHTKKEGASHEPSQAEIRQAGVFAAGGKPVIDMGESTANLVG